MPGEDEVNWLRSTKFSHWWGWPASHYCLGQTNECVKKEFIICIRSF